MALPHNNAGWYSELRGDLPTPPTPAPTTPGSLWQLLDERFSVFRGLVEKAGYTDLLNHPVTRVTVLAFPDQYLSSESKKALQSLDFGEAFNLIGIHLIPGIQTVGALADNKFLLPSYNQYQQVFFDAQNRMVGISAQIFQKTEILNEGDRAVNGIILVIQNPLIPQTNYV